MSPNPPFDPTPEQAAVLNHTPPDHARLLAGPGTGKSATMVALVNRLLDARPGYRARLLTFTRAATGELAKKVSGHPASTTLRPSTIHSFAISVLMQNPGAGDFPVPLRLADDWEYQMVLRHSLARYAGISLKTLGMLTQAMHSAWESLVEEETPDVGDATRSHFLGAWGDHRRAFGNTVLGELPYLLLSALQDHPDLEHADYDMLIVDEYQDLNACDLKVLRLLSARGASILGAGDDDQSIYSFRKADPEGIRRFLLDYPGAADYVLSESRRCGARILEWAQSVINGDTHRPPRPTLRPGQDAPAGEVALLAFDTNEAEATGVADLVEHLIDEGTPSNEILVLSRTDYNQAFSNPIKEHLERRGIASHDPAYVTDLLAEPCNRLFLERARLLVDREDSIAWASLLHLTPKIGKTLHDYVLGEALASRRTFGATLLALSAAGFQGAPRGSGARARDLVAAVTAWIDETSLPDGEAVPWGAWLALLSTEAAWTPTAQLSELLADIDDAIEEGSDLARYLGQIAPLGKDLALAKDGGVRFMSMGGSKGLTVKATIIVGVEDGVIPRPIEDLAEERRLLYVAMTRSREAVYCTWSRRRYGQTARAAGGATGARRNFCGFLRHGPVPSVDGKEYLSNKLAPSPGPVRTVG